MEEFVATTDLIMRVDCNFIAKEVMKIKSNAVVNRLYSVGPWVKIKYNDVEGWIYPFDSASNFLLELNHKPEFKLGDPVIVKGKKDTVQDEYGKSIVIKQDKHNLYFIVSEILSNPKLVRIKSSSKDDFYWVKPKSLEKAKLPNTDEFNNAGFWETVSSGINSITSAIGGIFGGSTAQQTQNPSQYPNEYFNPIDAAQQSMLESLSSTVKSWSPDSVTSEDGIEWSSARNKLAQFNLSNIRSIFGMPYQYMPIADMRFGERVRNERDDPRNTYSTRVDHNATTIQQLGAKYAEKIVARMPLMIMVPGIADFMAGFTASERETMLRRMVAGGDSDSNVESFINNFTTKMKGTRASFYNMYPAWVDYYNYVNPMCWVAAKFMGVDHYKLPGLSESLGSTNWSRALKEGVLQQSPAYNGGCAFYIQSESQISETLSNSTTQSAIAGKVNAVSDQGRELMFLSSSVDGMLEKAVGAASSVADNVTSVTQNAANGVTTKFTGSKLVKQFEQSGGAFHAILNGINNTIAGSKMLFPELWQDSQFTRNYSVRVKLDSPDNDPLSLYLNIVVPLIHLICFAAPRSMGPTTYASPFLVRAFYQGFFNINMGIIQDMTINKGTEGAWTLRNVPTVVEVSMDIKDLFATNLTISKSQTLDLNIITNTPLLDYVGNMCGVNINEPDWEKIVTLYSILAKGYASTYLTNLFDQVVAWVKSGNYNIYQSILAGNWNPTRWRF